MKDKKFNFDKIETSVITKKQTPETDEALVLLQGAKRKLKLIYILPMLALTIPAIIVSILSSSRAAVIGGSVYVLTELCLFTSIISTTVYLIIRGNFLRPYYRLLKVAMRNDDVRHEERIRFRERKRLEEDYAVEVSMRDKAKLEKQRDKSIAEMEKIDQKNELGDVRESTYKATSTKPAFKIPPYKKPE